MLPCSCGSCSSEDEQHAKRTRQGEAEPAGGDQAINSGSLQTAQLDQLPYLLKIPHSQNMHLYKWWLWEGQFQSLLLALKSQFRKWGPIPRNGIEQWWGLHKEGKQVDSLCLCNSLTSVKNKMHHLCRNRPSMAGIYPSLTCLYKLY